MTPRQTLALFEVPRVACNVIELALSPWLLLSPSGDGHHVFVIPGLGATDDSTGVLRAFLSLLGYRTSGWGLGRNLAHQTPGGFEVLERSFLNFASKSSEPVSIIGWSLGGVYGRQLARRYPHLVDQVICLGSPTGHDPGTIGVPCLSIYSETDAVVPPRLSRLPESPENTNIKVTSSHIGMGFNVRVLQLLAKSLAPGTSTAATAG